MVSIHLLGVRRGNSRVLAIAQIINGIPTLKRGAEFVIEDLHADLQ
jgi:hypothetical protein